MSAVLKKGDPSQHTNYRCIAVGNVLGKLFSMSLDAVWRLGVSSMASATNPHSRCEPTERNGEA